jgi:hypothetical protein
MLLHNRRGCFVLNLSFFRQGILVKNSQLAAMTFFPMRAYSLMPDYLEKR